MVLCELLRLQRVHSRTQVQQVPDTDQPPSGPPVFQHPLQWVVHGAITSKLSSSVLLGGAEVPQVHPGNGHTLSSLRLFNVVDVLLRVFVFDTAYGRRGTSQSTSPLLNHSQDKPRVLVLRTMKFNSCCWSICCSL